MDLAVRLPPLSGVEEPVEHLLGRVADAGFDGVVLVGLEGPHLPDVAAAVGETGLALVAAHVPLDRLQAERTRVVRDLRTVGCERVVVPELHAAHFESGDEIDRMATRLSALGGRLAADGRQLCYHNHDHEFRAVDGTDAFERLVERAGEGLAFEFDAGWAEVAGRDPATVIGTLEGRAPLVDVTPRVAETGERRLPGRGDVDLPGVVAAAASAGTAWLVHVAEEPPLHDEELAAAREVLAEVTD